MNCRIRLYKKDMDEKVREEKKEKHMYTEFINVPLSTDTGR